MLWTFVDDRQVAGLKGRYPVKTTKAGHTTPSHVLLRITAEGENRWKVYASVPPLHRAEFESEFPFNWAESRQVTGNQVNAVPADRVHKIRRYSDEE